MTEGSPHRAEAAGGTDGRSGPSAARRRQPADHALAELVSRVVERGAVVTGDLVVSVAGVDLLYVGLDVLLAAADRLEGIGGGDREPGEEDSAGGEAPRGEAGPGGEPAVPGDG